MNMVITALICNLSVVELPLVGEVVNANENSYYGLFPDEGFVQASLFQTDSGYIAFITLEKGPPVARQVSVEEMDILVAKINEKGQMSGAERNYFEDPNTTRLFIMPTGQNLAKGRSYFADYELFLLWYSYGVTNNLMFSAGFTLLPTTPDYWVFYLGPKVKLWDSHRGQSISAGMHLLIPPMQMLQDSFQLWGAGYLVGTSENKVVSLTAGGGALVFPNVYPGFFAGFKAGSGKIKFMAEYWHVIFTGEPADTIGMLQIPNLVFGVRFTGKNMSADLGLVYPYIQEYIGNGNYIGFPLVNFVYNF